MSETTPIQDATEDYIRNLKWADDTPSEVKMYVAGNIRGYLSFLTREGWV